MGLMHQEARLLSADVEGSSVFPGLEGSEVSLQRPVGVSIKALPELRSLPSNTLTLGTPRLFSSFCFYLE